MCQESNDIPASCLPENREMNMGKGWTIRFYIH